MPSTLSWPPYLLSSWWVIVHHRYPHPTHFSPGVPVRAIKQSPEISHIAQTLLLPSAAPLGRGLDSWDALLMSGICDEGDCLVRHLKYMLSSLRPAWLSSPPLFSSIILSFIGRHHTPLCWLHRSFCCAVPWIQLRKAKRGSLSFGQFS